MRHQQTPANVIQCQPEQQHILKLSFGVLGTVSWCLVVSVVVLNCPEIPGGGDCEHMGEVYVCLWGFGCVLGSFRVFMPCMVQQMLYIGNA